MRPSQMPGAVKTILGKIAFAAAAICAAAMPSFGAKPYDAEVEYLDANATTGPTSFFDTGLLPADDVGARIRFSPKQAKNDTVLFGMRSSEGTRWYFGGPSSGGYYFGRMENTATTVRPNMVANSVYDVRYNHFNERALRVSGVDGATMTYGGASTSEFYLPVSTEWTHEDIPDVASWVVPHSVGPRFPGPLLIRTRCPDTSPNSRL